MEPITVVVDSKVNMKERGTGWVLWFSDNQEIASIYWSKEPLRGRIVKEKDNDILYKIIGVETQMVKHPTTVGILVSEMITLDPLENPIES